MTELAQAALQGMLPGFAAALLLARLAGARWQPAAFAIGLFVAYGWLKHWPPWPWALAGGTNDGTQWLVWSVVAATVTSGLGADRWPAPVLPACAALVLASAHGGLLLAGHHFAEPSRWALLATAVAPALGLVGPRMRSGAAPRTAPGG